MQFSNDNITYAAEEPYSTSKVWTLAPGLDGPRTVYVRFRDCSLPLTPAPGGTLYSAITATINLDTTGLLTTASLIITVSYPSASNAPGQPVSVSVIYPYDPLTAYFPLRVRLGSVSQGVIAF